MFEHVIVFTTIYLPFLDIGIAFTKKKKKFCPNYLRVTSLFVKQTFRCVLLYIECESFYTSQGEFCIIRERI